MYFLRFKSCTCFYWTEIKACKGKIYLHRNLIKILGQQYCQNYFYLTDMLFLTYLVVHCTLPISLKFISETLKINRKVFLLYLNDTTSQKFLKIKTTSASSTSTYPTTILNWISSLPTSNI